MTFLFQLGVVRDAVAAPAHLLTLAHLKDLAVKFVHDKVSTYTTLYPGLQKSKSKHLFLLNHK